MIAPPLLAADLSDISGHWAEPQIRQAVAQGYVSGYPDGTFQPDRTLRRAEFVKILAAALKLAPMPDTQVPFADAANHWVAAQGWLQAAVKAGIVAPENYPQGFDPDGNLPRWEIAVLVMRALGVRAEQAAAAPAPSFPDAGTIPGSAQGYVSLAVSMKIITGYPDGTFRGGDTANRAQAVVMTQRMLGAMNALAISSPAFAAGAPIPQTYTCDGQNISPPLQWQGVPAGARSLALIVDDPDAPSGTFTHWLAWNIAPDTTQLAENFSATAPASVGQGTSDFRQPGYGGPCPPPGAAHHYHFTLYALDTALDLAAGAGKQQLLDAMQGHIVAQAELVGTYQRG